MDSKVDQLHQGLPEAMVRAFQRAAFVLQVGGVLLHAQRGGPYCTHVPFFPGHMRCAPTARGNNVPDCVVLLFCDA